MRSALLALATACLLAAAAWWLLSLPSPSREREAFAPVIDEQAVSTGATPTRAASFTTPARLPLVPEDEAVLRQLEPLSVTDKPRALELALAADRRLPDKGAMAEARRALIVTLLVDTQRMAEARSRAREFFRLYATSRYVPLVRGVTGLHSRPTLRESRDALSKSR
jgi:hypothetical protein